MSFSRVKLSSISFVTKITVIVTYNHQCLYDVLTQLVDECWDDDPDSRPSFDYIKKTVHRINPNKLSPVDLMMAMASCDVITCVLGFCK